MLFSPQQDAALVAVADWLKAGSPQIFRLFGYAGTGKTTLARHIAEDIDGDVLFAAFTGKAAQVLRSAGAENARTIHSLIYRPRGEETVEDEDKGTTTVSPMFSLNRASPVGKAALVIVDECSMVDEELGRDLLSFGTPLLGSMRSSAAISCPSARRCWCLAIRGSCRRSKPMTAVAVFSPSTSRTCF